MKNISLSGSNLADNSIVGLNSTNEFENIQSFEIHSSRDASNQIQISLEDSDILIYELEDGGEWIGSAIEFEEFCGTKIKRSRDGSVILPFRIEYNSSGTSRGVFKSVAIKFFHVLRPKVTETITGEAAKQIAKALDNRLVKSPGLYTIGQDFKIEPIADLKPSSERFLLLVHGTANHTIGSFGAIAEGQQSPWARMYAEYSGRCIALEHHTLAESPLQNVIDFLTEIPLGLSVDILSQSRGGIVADILSRCDSTLSELVFSPLDLELAKKEDKTTHALMVEVNRLAKVKKLKVGKIVRVSSPSNGTKLLEEGLDKFLNVLLNGVKLAFGLGIIYGVVKDLVLQIIKHRMDTEYVPGLAAMKSDNVLLRILNSADHAVNSQLYVVAGDAEFGKSVFQSVIVILSNLYYREPNDFIVETDSMDKGPIRIGGYGYFLSKSSETQHFKYFSNQHTRQAILGAFTIQQSLDTQFSTRGLSRDRGPVLDHFSMHENSTKDFTGTRPVVVLIPGIMGSILRSNGEMIWVDLREIAKGKVVNDLHIQAPDVTASGVVDEFYGKFIKKLGEDFDVITFPFDWRKSVSEAAIELKKCLQDLQGKTQFPIRIVAHSMGGLVVKSLMRNEPDFWQQYINRPESRFIMLGTPWLGSYLIMEVLTGHSSRVNQIKYLDLKHSEKELISVFNKFPGLYDLLPIDEREIESKEFWEELNEGLKEEILVPAHSNLAYFKLYKEQAQTESFDLTNCWYVAGKADQTTYNYTIKSRLFGNKIQFQSTNEGDGSVTWGSGIPKDLDKNNLYYCVTEHGDLANDQQRFDGIIDLIRFGNTNKLLRTKPTYRSGEILDVRSESMRIPRDLDDFKYNLFGSETQTEQLVVQSELKVKVVNGDLREAQYPVVAGHMVGDAIENAEGAIDKYLKGRLTERKNLGTYPSLIGEHSIFSAPDCAPSMAMVIGLGRVEDLTSYNLKRSIEKAIVSLAVHSRDNNTHTDQSMNNGVSFLLIGTNYGKLPVRESVKAIISGVRKANLLLSNASTELPLINEIEIIDYYEDVAVEAFIALKELNESESRNRFELHGKIEPRRGVRKKNSMYRKETWWHQFSTVGMVQEGVLTGLKFDSSAGFAKVSTKTIQTGIKQVGILLNQLSERRQWDKKISKTLFELMIPNEFKNVVRSQNHLVWKMDVNSAAFPWELFHDGDFDSVPTFVNCGLVRQLYSDDIEESVNRVPHNRALVVGDPIYNDPRLSQLPGAVKEANIAVEFFRNNSIETMAMISKDSVDIMTSLFDEPIKYLHFAGHGLYDPKNGEVGIAIGDGITINPSMLNQLSYVPEFVFINCCYSGKVSSEDQRYYKSRYQLAANIGVELIEKGVKAVIVTGWAVDDDAAETFARSFYRLMFAGYKFGEAIQIARKTTYTDHGYSHTWGAYQCYGDPYYAFKQDLVNEEKDLEYVVVNQVYNDLDETFFQAKQGDFTNQLVLAKLENILQMAQKSGFNDAIIIEKTAMIYYELDLIEKAYQSYKQLLLQEKAYFSVKALELYCYLRARVMNVNNVKNVRDIKVMLKDILQILGIGETRERFSVLGFGYQKAAELTIKKSFGNPEEYLEKMFHHYSEACNLQNDNSLSKYSECFASRLVAAYALKTINPEFGYQKTLGLNNKEIQALLDDLNSQIERELATNGSTELQVASARTKAVGLLFVEGKHHGTLTKITSLYSEAFKTFPNTKRITEELDSYRFIKLFELSGETRKTVDAIIELLEKFRNRR